MESAVENGLEERGLVKDFKNIRCVRSVSDPLL